MPKVLPEYKKQATEKILHAAKELFAEKGYHEARMEDIAERVGVSKRTLYLYFKNKEELFAAMVASAPQALKGNLESALNTTDLLETCAVIFDSALKDPYIGLNFEMIAAASRNPTLRRTMKTLYEAQVDVTEQFLRGMKKKGILPSGLNETLLARALLALYDGLTADIIVGLDRSRLRETWLRTARVLVESFSKSG